MEPIAIKAFYGEEVRRFSVDSIAGFAEMMHELKTRFGMNEDQKVALKFKDDEDELCTFTNDEEMREAIRIVATGMPEDSMHLRFNVYIEDQKPTLVLSPTPPQAVMMPWCNFRAGFKGKGKGKGKGCGRFGGKGGHHHHHHPDHQPASPKPLEQWSEAELKKELSAHGMDYSECVEIDDLITLLRATLDSECGGGKGPADDVEMGDPRPDAPDVDGHLHDYRHHRHRHPHFGVRCGGRGGTGGWGKGGGRGIGKGMPGWARAW